MHDIVCPAAHNRQTEVGLVVQDALGKDVVKIGFPPAKKLGWVSMEKSSTGEQMLMSKVGLPA